MPQGMVQLEDGSWVPVGTAPQPQPQPQPQQDLNPRSFVQTDFDTQLSAVKETAARQWDTINKQRRKMGIDKTNAMLQKLDADYQKQVDTLTRGSAQKVTMMDAVEALISQGAVSEDDSQQMAKLQNLMWKTASGSSELADALSPIPKDNKEADPLAAYNAVQALQSKLQTDSNRFTQESNTSFFGGEKTTSLYETRGTGSNREDVEVFRSVYDTKKRRFTSVTGQKYMDRHNIRLDQLEKVSKIISDFEATGRLTTAQETLLETWSNKAGNGATVGEHVKGRAIVNSSKKNRAADKSRLVAVNPTTNERIISIDGGVTWQPEN